VTVPMTTDTRVVLVSSPGGPVIQQGSI
jgi:hypothetical protein